MIKFLDFRLDGCLNIPAEVRYRVQHGEVAEWSKAHAWKVCRRGTVSRVRIPVSPPPTLVSISHVQIAGFPCAIPAAYDVWGITETDPRRLIRARFRSCLRDPFERVRFLVFFPVTVRFTGNSEETSTILNVGS